MSPHGRELRKKSHANWPAGALFSGRWAGSFSQKVLHLFRSRTSDFLSLSNLLWKFLHYLIPHLPLYSKGSPDNTHDQFECSPYSFFTCCLMNTTTRNFYLSEQFSRHI